jgi:predicted DNA-binding transcriptional regulator
VAEFTAKEPVDVLRGTTLDIYLFLLKNGSTVGIREIQRVLKVSSPSVVHYHLSKLEDAGLLKRKKGTYVIAKVCLENRVKISRFLIPRYLFYFVFSTTVLILELTIFRPTILYREYFFSTIATAILVIILCYETVKAWLSSNL